MDYNNANERNRANTARFGMDFMKKIGFCFALSALLLASGCSWLRVHTIDLPQGTPIDQSVAQRVQLGMTPDQVVYLLGSPARQDTLTPNRWDYIYDYTAGTDGKAAGKTDIKNASQYLRIYFDNGRVAKIEGLESLPADRH